LPPRFRIICSRKAEKVREWEARMRAVAAKLPKK
jgi:hypothetical protein